MATATQNKRTICVEFDGVIHRFDTPFTDAVTIPDAPVMGAMSFLLDLVEDDRFEVVVHSSRRSSPEGVAAIETWLRSNLKQEYDEDLGSATARQIRVVGIRPGATVTVDDRAIRFEGKFPAMDGLASFTPWNRTPEGAPFKAGSNSPEEVERWLKASGHVDPPEEDDRFDAAVEAVVEVMDAEGGHTASDVVRAVLAAYEGRAA